MCLPQSMRMNWVSKSKKFKWHAYKNFDHDLICPHKIVISMSLENNLTCLKLAYLVSSRSRVLFLMTSI